MDINDTTHTETIEQNNTRPQIRVSGFALQSNPTNNNANPPMKKIQKKNDQHNESDITSDNHTHDNNVTNWIKQDNSANNTSPIFITDIKSSPINEASNSTMTSPSSGQKSVRRRIRRKNNNSPDDQTECLTEMSVRGLNLFRYASIQDGVYQCTECLKENVQKTFKNKYSFQRHAFLYHEGTQRKGK